MRRLVAVIAAAILVAAGASPAPAQMEGTVGIRIVDAPVGRTNDPRARQYIVDHLAPGTTIRRRVEVSNDTTAAQVIKLYPAAATIADGSITFGEGQAANDLTRWTSIDPPTVSPPPGRKALATVTITVPANAPPGEQYGVVWAELAPAVPAGGGVTAVNRVGVRMYVSVGPGGEPASDFAITDLQAQRSPDGIPQLAATVRNTGGRAIDLSGELRLANGPGGLSAGPFDSKLGTTLGLGQSAPVLVPLDPAIPRGPWDARIILRSGTTERDASANVTFPEAAAASAEPVRTDAGTTGRALWPLGAVGGAVALVLAGGAALLLRARLRRGSQPGG